MFSLLMAQADSRLDAFTEPTGCASKLIHEQGKFHLYLPFHDVPIQQFDTLADYIEYWKVLHRRGNTCPILYYESQGKDRYREVAFDAALARALEYEERAAQLRSAPSKAADDPSLDQVTPHVPTPTDDPVATVDRIGPYQGTRTHWSDRGALARSVDLDYPRLGTPGLSTDPLHPRYGGPDYRADVLKDRGFVLTPKL